MPFATMLRLMLAATLVLAGTGCGGGGSSAPICSGNCGEPIVDGAGSSASAFPQSDTLQLESFQGLLTTASLLPVIGSGVQTQPITAPTASSCSNNETQTVTAGSVPATLNVTVHHFYDPGCTKLWWSGVFVATNNSVTTTLTGTSTYYTSSGNVYASVGPATLIITAIGPSTSFSISASVASSPTAAATAQFGVTCNTTSGTHACSYAAVEGAAAQSGGIFQDVQSNFGVTTSGTTTTVSYATMSGFGEGYGGPGIAPLAPSSSPLNAWTVSNISSSHGITSSGSVSYSASGMSALSLSSSDVESATTTSLSFNPITQIVTGTVAPSAGGATIASVSLSPLGQGTITYHDGTTAPIVNWVIQS